MYHISKIREIQTAQLAGRIQSDIIYRYTVGLRGSKTKALAKARGGLSIRRQILESVLVVVLLLWRHRNMKRRGVEQKRRQKLSAKASSLTLHSQTHH